MLALLFNEHGLNLDSRFAPPQPAAGEVVVDVAVAGICETDLQLVQGYMGFHGVLGHEFVGVARSGRYAGRRVVGEINCNCRECGFCEAGLGTHCPERTVVGILNHHGAFAEQVAIPEHNLRPVPDSVPDDIAVFTEPVAAAFQIHDQLALSTSERTAILGDGRLGQLCAQVFRALGHDPLVVGKHANKLDVIAARGIRTELLSSLQDQREFDIVVDCTGRANGIETALRLVRPRGTIVLKTTVAGQQSLSLAPIVIDEITVVGSRCGPFDKALDALRKGLVDVSPMIAARYPLSDAIAALKHAATPGTLKVLLDVSADAGERVSG